MGYDALVSLIIPCNTINWREATAKTQSYYVYGASPMKHDGCSIRVYNL